MTLTSIKYLNSSVVLTGVFIVAMCPTRCLQPVDITRRSTVKDIWFALHVESISEGKLTLILS